MYVGDRLSIAETRGISNEGNFPKNKYLFLLGTPLEPALAKRILACVTVELMIVYIAVFGWAGNKKEC